MHENDITKQEMLRTIRVLEIIRERFRVDGMSSEESTINEAHALVQEEMERSFGDK